MSFNWLKRYMPRGLYGRALLILVLPVVTLQLVVSVVFIQRHFEGVTRQMTRGVGMDLRYLLDTPGALEAAAALRYRSAPVEAASLALPDQRRWFDFSGHIVIRELREMLPELRRVALPSDREVQLWIESADGPLRISFDRRRVSATNPHQLLVNMALFGLLMTVIAYLYLRNQLRPITRMAAAAEAFGRGQVVRYRPGGAVEVRAAGRAFVEMRARIERYIDQRTLMLSGVSHDLRTPLTRMKLALSMSEDPEAEALRADVAEMEALITAFLDFAREEAGDQPVPTDPAALLEGIVADACRAGKDVSLSIRGGPTEVPLKQVTLRRAVENLLVNATRYGTRAEVVLKVTDRALVIAVEDDGPGIPEDLREAALRPFTRLDPARNQDRGSGVGLGLAIANDAARAHGGRLRLGESAHLGGLKAEIVLAAA